MKSNIFTIILITFIGFTATAQVSGTLVANQNPNYQISQDKYIAINEVSDLTLTQGTTAQETYTAIDPMEEKRKRQELRKHYRSQRPLWRHQERMERAKNTTYYSRRYRNFNNRRFYSRSLFNLGMLSYFIFD